MAKKSRSRTKRRSHKKPAQNLDAEVSFRVPQHGPQSSAFAAQEHQYNENFSPMAGSPRDLEAGPSYNFLKFDGESRDRPQTGGRGESRAPLTDRNLQTLLEQSSPSTRHRRPSGIALDMDKFARESDHYNRFAGHADGHMHDDVSLYSNQSRESSLAFGESNPSSDHSSDSTSLDDVCFPDYYEGSREHGANLPTTWPDLSILADFIVEEQEDLKEAMEEVPAGVNFQYPVARKVSSFGEPEIRDLKESRERKEARRASGVSRGAQLRAAEAHFPQPGSLPGSQRGSGNTTGLGNDIPTSEETPLLNSVHVDETTSMKSNGSSLRVRPRAIQPWEKSREKVHTILANGRGNPGSSSNIHSNSRSVEATYRFTYFREDIDGTIHSPTLSGLVSDTDRPTMSRDQISDKLSQLFAPENSPIISNSDSASTADAATISHNTGPGTTGTTPGHSTGNFLNLANTASNTGGHSRTHSQKLDSPMPPSISALSENLASASANSVAGDVTDGHVAPFWLDITDPSEEEMKVLSKTFGLHPLTTEDIFLGETREKVELFRQYYFICFTSFDIVYERRKQRKMEHEKKLTKLLEYDSDGHSTSAKKSGILRRVKRFFGDDKGTKISSRLSSKMSVTDTSMSKNHRIRSGELCPLNMYMIIFETGVLTFHFNPTPHPINVRRRARMLKDHLTVSTDWICYALIDDITDSFAPMIDSIEMEVYNIEDEIMRMHSGDSTDDSDDSDESDDEYDGSQARPVTSQKHTQSHGNDVFYRRQRSKSIVEPHPSPSQFLRGRSKRGSHAEYMSLASAKSRSTTTASSKSTSSKIVAWKRKGDMLRRIGECRKRVMSVMRLLGTKADVIKGFSKRFSENDISGPKITKRERNNRLASKQEIVMYLGDIQDHIVTMVQSLNHYEKLLARSHSNYLAQLNIDMTKVNNDTNDILGKVTILGTIVLPINVVTGLWGMNCIVPGQAEAHPGLTWFYGILIAIFSFSILSYIYARRVTGL